MTRRLCVALLLVGGLAAPPGSAAAQRSSLLLAGPVFAGAGVAWSESSGSAEAVVLRLPRGSPRVVYRSTVDAIEELDGSRSLLALWRSYPGCPPSPDLVCPQVNDALAGPPLGPFRPMLAPRSCFPAAADRLDVDGMVIGLVELDCDGERVELVVRDLTQGGGPLVVHEASITGDCCSGVRVAGRFVAWLEERAAVVYDRVSGRNVYRVRLGSQPVRDFDLQRDGKLVIALGSADLEAPTVVAWAAPSRPKLRVLSANGHVTGIQIAGDQIALTRRAGLTRRELVVSDLTGQGRIIARFRPPLHSSGNFDFDGNRLTWAADRITASRVDCPPPGVGAPCFMRLTGVTTIWARNAAGGMARIIAALPFEDVPG